MAEQSYPFDAAGAAGTGGSATVLEGEWQRIMRSLVASGVISGHPDSAGLLAVTAAGAAMQVTEATGLAWVEGFLYRNDAAKVLNIGAADAANPRIDTVVLRLDRAANSTTCLVKQGLAAASPVAPALTQTDLLWDLPLADVRVDAAVGVIAAAKVTDRRAVKGKPVQQDGGDTITASGPTVKPLIVRGAPGGTAILLDVQDGAGASALVVSAASVVAASFLSVGPVGNDKSATLVLSTSLASRPPLLVRGIAGQTAPLANLENSAGLSLVNVTASGTLNTQGMAAYGATDANSAGVANLMASSAVGMRALAVRGAPGQTANVLEVQSSAGAPVFSVAPGGSVAALDYLCNRVRYTGTLEANFTPGATAAAISVLIDGGRFKIPAYVA